MPAGEHSIGGVFEVLAVATSQDLCDHDDHEHHDREEEQEQPRQDQHSQRGRRSDFDVVGLIVLSRIIGCRCWALSSRLPLGNRSCVLCVCLRLATCWWDRVEGNPANALEEHLGPCVVLTRAHRVEEHQAGLLGLFGNAIANGDSSREPLLTCSESEGRDELIAIALAAYEELFDPTNRRAGSGFVYERQLFTKRLLERLETSKVRCSLDQRGEFHDGRIRVDDRQFEESWITAIGDRYFTLLIIGCRDFRDHGIGAWGIGLAIQQRTRIWVEPNIVCFDSCHWLTGGQPRSGRIEDLYLLSDGQSLDGSFKGDLDVG